MKQLFLIILIGITIACQNENSRSNDKRMFSNLIGSEISLINGASLFGSCMTKGAALSAISAALVGVASIIVVLLNFSLCMGWI